MSRARITYKGAYHHTMNRGHEGKCIFSKDREKEFFLKLLVSLKEKAGLKYDEIIKFTIFSDIKLHSLGIP